MITIGIILFPQIEELDFVGPYEVLSYINKIRPDSTRVLLVAEDREPVAAFNGLRIIPDTTLAECPPLDIIVAPGGKGRLAAMKNQVILAFLRNRQTRARFVTSVCTGAFLLAEAGLLTGRKATTYHTAFSELAAYSVEVLPAKVVRDGAIVTAGGVSSGLELGFYLLRELFGADLAQEVARKIEYDVDVIAL
ncbi:DJ-1/PfpI family protein [Anaeroselena agilis]|uniref:DJ-1/PfpI family protein n=1 Tax=Anaeroselena agilis TaxID=3063788 RepID=A0ABU3P2L2_9FIRM|nr:DJ-1/PfpI family protein [Selenomonadales bacterium 4137-cl]